MTIVVFSAKVSIQLGVFLNLIMLSLLAIETEVYPTQGWTDWLANRTGPGSVLEENILLIHEFLLFYIVYFLLY